MSERLELANAALRVSIDTLGAELMSVRTAEGNEWLWQGDPAHWSSRAPIMFPVIGRSRDGRVRIGDRTWPMPSHGFARQSVFAVVSAEDERCVLRLLDTPLSRLSFPFSFCLEATFTLDHTALIVGLKLTNTDSVPFPAAFGFHPGFVHPLPGASGRHTVRWHGNSVPSIRRLDPNGLIQPREPLPSPSRESTIGIDSLDGGAIFLSDWGGIVTFGPVTGPQLRIETEGFAFLGLWTVREGPFLCIEPCTGLADAAGDLRDLADRPGATLLEPGATMSAHAIIVPRASS